VEGLRDRVREAIRSRLQEAVRERIQDAFQSACWGATLTPTFVAGLSDAVAISAGAGHTCAVRATGSVLCWGDGSYGELGNGSTMFSTTPLSVVSLTDAIDVSAGDTHSCAVRAGGGVACWGNGEDGQLGDGRPWWSTPQDVSWTPPL
jgi:alpha-tubulin suppressor-like RCC1 family protein